MRIIEIQAQENGAHRNQESDFVTIPNGCAVIPEDMETPNFPFGEIIVEIIDGIPMVTKWTPGVIPEVEPTPEPEPTSDIDDFANAILEGVNEV